MGVRTVTNLKSDL